MKLKNESDVLASRRRPGFIQGVRHQPTVYPYLALVRSIQQTQQVQQRGFSASRRSDHCINFAATGLERDSSEYVHPALALPKMAVQAGATKDNVVGCW